MTAHEALVTLGLAAVLLLPTACGDPAGAQEQPAPPAPARQPAPSETDRVLAEIRRLYEKAKESGEKVPGDVMEWAKAEAQRRGTFEYRVEQVDDADAVGIELSLNELGRDRWECFDVEEQGTVARLYFRRPVTSHLSPMILRDLLRLLPLLPFGGDSGGDGGK